MVNLSDTGTPQSDIIRKIPPLESGDRLTVDEFEQRYTAASYIKKAELIEGIVYVASPLRFESHAQPHGRLMTWLGVYEASTPGVQLGIEPTLRLDRNNQPQPDGVLLIPQNIGGQSRLSKDDYIEGAPELVAEIAASSVALDLNDKKEVYRRHGVQEYIVWQIFEKKLNWYKLQSGNYISMMPDANGVIQSQIFSGLWLSVPDLLAGNVAQVLSLLQQGLNSPEHKAFVELLAQAQS